MTDRITPREFHGTDGADAWRVLPEGAVAAVRSDPSAVSMAVPS